MLSGDGPHMVVSSRFSLSIHVASSIHIEGVDLAGARSFTSAGQDQYVLIIE
jgi:hypothetical protein